MPASDALVDPLVLSLSKDEPFCSWFDKLTTSDVYGDLEVTLVSRSVVDRCGFTREQTPPHSSQA